MNHHRRSAVLALVLILLMPSIALADAPANDTFETATVIGALPYSSAVDLTEATDDPDEFGDCESFARHRIWYRYSPPEDQVVQLSVGDQGEEGIRVEYGLWNVTAGDPSATNLMRCATEGRDLVEELLAGQSYAFVLGQDQAGPPWFSGTLTVDAVPSPANDDFANAAAVGDGDSVQVRLGPILAASRESGEPAASCDSEAGTTTNTMWYRFTVPAQASAVVHTDIGGIAAVFSGDAVGALTELACTEEDTTFDIGPGTYSIQLSGRPFQVQGMNLSLDLTIPPANDDFADGTSIGTLPYEQVGIDMTLGTTEADEPTPCSNGFAATAWWTWTATAKGQLKFHGYSLPLGAWSGTDLASLTPLGCSQSGWAAVAVNPGDVVHMRLATPNTEGPFGIQVDFAPAPANDDFADAATIGSVPFDAEVDLNSASFQAGEPVPSCYATPVTTLWYRFTATGASTSFSFDPGYRQVAVAAYTGTSLDSLTQIGCASGWTPPVFTIKPPAGTTVRIQVAVSDNEGIRSVGLHVGATPDPIVDFYAYPGDPSVFTDMSFSDATNDPGGAARTLAWTFGDGSSSTDQYPIHRYAKDGDYDVTLAVMTEDGRTGSATKTVSVRTHDVEIVEFDVPSSARSGQTKTITVSLGNRHYRETGSLQLSAIRPGGSWEVIDQRSDISMRVTRGARTTDVKFKYEFTEADAMAGKVSFRVLLFIDGVYDVAPGDNDITAPPTFVTR